MNVKESPFHARKNLDDLTQGMTAKEIEAIKTGSLCVGMSKAAVVVAYGYPPEHVTPSLDNDVWTYWMDRFRKKQSQLRCKRRTVKGPVGNVGGL